MSNNAELDVINHLLEVEKNASVLIDDAKIEADKRVAEARSKYNQEYKAGYETIASEKDAAYHKKLQEITDKHSAEIESFKKSFEDKPQNTEAFNALLEKLLFANS